MNNSYLSLQNFSFAFKQGDQQLFFKDISLQIDQPGLIFILGKNGVGKSTFLRCMQGIIYSNEYCSGSLKINDKSYNLSELSDRDDLHNQSRVLYQSFDSMLASSFTGYQNLAFANFDQNPTLSFVSVDLQAPDFMQKFHIPLEKEVSLMSGGQRQMLALLMVTQKMITLLLLDEPTAALDTKNSDYVMQGIATLAKEKNICIICISHDADIIKKYADYTINIIENDDAIKTFKVEKKQ